MKNLKITRRAKMVILSVAFAVVVMVFVACASRCDKRGENETPTVTPTNTIVIPATATPTLEPTSTPTLEPTATQAPTDTPTPTVEPTDTPTPEPTETPTPEPTEEPTPEPTATPTSTPTPTVEPTKPATPTPKPATPTPTVEPTQEPTKAPTQEPTKVPTQEPTKVPTQEPTPIPTEAPSEAELYARAERVLRNIEQYHINPYTNGYTLIGKTYEDINKRVDVNGITFPIHKVTYTYLKGDTRVQFSFYHNGLQYMNQETGGWSYSDDLKIDIFYGVATVEDDDGRLVITGIITQGSAINGVGQLFKY